MSYHYLMSFLCYFYNSDVNPTESQQSNNQRNFIQERANDLSTIHQPYANILISQRGPSTAEAALVRSHMDGTEKYQKISEIGKGT